MFELAPAATCAALGAAGGLLVPTLIGRIPEPDTEFPEDDPKEPYADIARLPGLIWKSALASGIAAGLAGGILGWVWPLLYLVPLSAVAVALAVVDWRTRLLPTRVIWPSFGAVAVGVLVAAVVTGDGDDLVRAGLGALIAFGLFYVLWFIYPKGLGFGDVRLSAVLGLALGYLGWSQLLVGVYAGFLLGAVIGSGLSLLKLVDRKGYPFGPFMLVGVIVGIAWGPAIADQLAAR